MIVQLRLFYHKSKKKRILNKKNYYKKCIFSLSLYMLLFDTETLLSNKTQCFGNVMGGAQVNWSPFMNATWHNIQNIFGPTACLAAGLLNNICHRITFI